MLRITLFPALRFIAALFLLAGSLSHGYAQGKITLRGIVSDTNGEVIPGAIITIKPADKITTTNTEGQYEITGIGAGLIVIQVHSIGYTDTTDSLLLSQGLHIKDIRLKEAVNELDHVRVVGTRQSNENAETLVKIKNSIMPVTIVDRRTIELMGSRRLDEVLKEQTGMAIVNDIASGSRSVGVQMQGFGSEYIMILIDGQPMVGRSGGNFDLSRISVSNIERVEITKGAASNIYGGDALGGTINIITRHDVNKAQGMAAVSYGSNETADISVEAETPVLKQKGSVWLSTNYYHTGGFNTSEGSLKGTTAPPYDNYAGQGRFRYQFNDKNRLSVSARYGLRRSFMTKDYGVSYALEDQLDEQDINLSANFDHRFNDKWRSMTRYYFSGYHADMSVALTQGDSVSQNRFGQNLHRFEQQFSYSLDNKLDVIGGLGGTIESIDENILSNVNEIKSYFAFTQANWNIISRLRFTLGLRYDHIVDYGWRLDPSMALEYKIAPSLIIKAAYGTAFKAPDMRKLYQVSYNPASNFIMVGSSVLRELINQMREAGQVSQYELESVYDEIKGKALNAEMSKSYNLSMTWESPAKRTRVEGSIFHHDITNQINPVLIGMDIDRRVIYSYRNHARAYFRGAELSADFTLFDNLKLSTGYQYLLAKDQTVADEIREGGKFYAPLFDPNTGYVNYSPSGKDYWGIENRSRHMLNAKVFYTYRPLDISASIRVNFRGKYPFSDKNNNGYMDRFDTFVRGHYLLNAGVEKKIINRRISLRINAENLLDFVDPKVPFQPGRVFFAGVSYNFSKQ